MPKLGEQTSTERREGGRHGHSSLAPSPAMRLLAMSRYVLCNRTVAEQRGAEWAMPGHGRFCSPREERRDLGRNSATRLGVCVDAESSDV